jgi:hypothetical protein
MRATIRSSAAWGQRDPGPALRVRHRVDTVRAQWHWAWALRDRERAVRA